MVVDLLDHLVQALSRFRPPAADLALAVGVGLVDLALVADGADPLSSFVSLPTVGYAALGCAVLAYRRSAPSAVLVLCLLHLAIGVAALPAYRAVLAPLVALYSVAALRPLRQSVAGLVITVVTTCALALIDQIGRGLGPGETVSAVARAVIAVLTLLAFATWGVGRWVRSSRESLSRARRVAELERRAAVAAERVAIARDMHDTVTSAVTAVLLQAAGARAVLRSDPDRAGTALDAIEEASGRALTELRGMLGVLRSDPGPSTLPADLRSHAAALAAAGFQVDLVTDGARRPLATGTSDTVRRVVQEALTNVAKHAGPGSRVRIGERWTPTALEITVHDDGSGVPPDSPAGSGGGDGLRGMAERVAERGGTVSAGPVGGGFEVRVVLPLGTGVGADAEATGHPRADGRV